jgi:hypothetical protein
MRWLLLSTQDRFAATDNNFVTNLLVHGEKTGELHRQVVINSGKMTLVII